MSQYRDDKDAARYRIDALEDKLAEHEKDLAARDQKLAEQDAEIKMLRRELRDGPDPHQGQTRRPAVVVATLGLAMMASMGAFSALRWVGSPASVLVVPSPPALQGHPPTNLTTDTVWDGLTPHATNGPSSAPTEGEMAEIRSLENKVDSGQASSEDLRMLKALCGHAGDKGCHDLAAGLLKQRRTNP